MKYAIVDTEKREALQSGERGICICCGSETIAYCGEFMIHHWKHRIAIECDTWHENETEWHRWWKNQFPKTFQEIVKFDPFTGEKHIADIFHPDRLLTLEFQHSQIRLEEIKSREKFHTNLTWVVDVSPYNSNINFHKNIAEAFFDCVVLPWATNQDRIVRELRKQGKDKEVSDYLNNRTDDVYIEEFEKRYSHSRSDEYFLMQWKYQHKRWNHTGSPLFFDAGDDYIYMNIETIKIWNGFIVKRFDKREFISRFIQKR